ncbi:hypothetical protein F5Y16DRAFT_330852 [Xylariaceae sp. FL0255]|nr:hypothetical protein F5Y16DRAFT_330852 [Xylariaceae sp. FL0255]
MVDAGFPHWLSRYGTGYHAWRREAGGFARPLGVVEARFDTDGRYFGGRADINPGLTLGLATKLSDQDLQRHILLAYTLLGLNHCLLRAKAELRTYGIEPWFVVKTLATPSDAIEDAASNLHFIDAAVEGPIDAYDFNLHAQNVARVVDPNKALTRGFVLPIESTSDTRRTLRMQLVMAHQIADGLTSMNWIADFIRIMNLPTVEISRRITAAVGSPEAVRATLPPAQEDLYAPVAPTKARTRWFWAITIVLRHVKKPFPPAFPNPLRRDRPLSKAQSMHPKYARILDYSETPPLNTFSATVELSKAASQRLFRLCREAKASIGAGGFVLVAMAMMALHERRYPNESDDERRPFIGSFPLNPRPFINTKCLDTVMLAFCEGVLLPFLPSHLDLEGRFRLLVRAANRQLSAYQKRVRPQTDAEAKAYMGIHGTGRLIASNYIDGMERLRALLPSHLKNAIPPPRGGFDNHVSKATCGVSSVGKVDWSASRFDLNVDPGDGVITSIEGLRSGVRVRDNEFLVGISGDNDIVHAGVSFDGNYIAKEDAQLWVEAMKSLLEPSGFKHRL